MGKARANRRQAEVYDIRDSHSAFFDDNTKQRHPKQTPSHRKYRKNISAKTKNQEILSEAIDTCTLTIAKGKPGTGKTFISVIKGVDALMNGEVEKLVVTTPAVEAGENLGFLPGTMEEKVEPHYAPIYDSILERMPLKTMASLIASKQIEIAPLAYIRGRTFNNSFIILDEAQNCTYLQIKTAYTRMGIGSKMVISGDPNQSDIPESGLEEFTERLNHDIEGIGIVELTAADIVRHPLLARTMKYLED